MKLIDGVLYANHEDAMLALTNKLDRMKEEKETDGLMLLAIGLTCSSLIHDIFKEGETENEGTT